MFGRWKYGAVVVLAGLGALLLGFGFAVWIYQDVVEPSQSAGAIATVLAPITSVIGTIVAAYFGVQAGQQVAAQAQAQTAHAQEEREKAVLETRRLLSVADEETMARYAAELRQERPPDSGTE